MSCDYEGPFHDYNCTACSTTVYPTTDNTKGALIRVTLLGVIVVGVIVYLTQYA